MVLCLGRSGWLWLYLQHNFPSYCWKGKWQRNGQFASIIAGLFPLLSWRGRNQFSYPSSLSQVPQWIFRIQNWETFLIIIYLFKFLLSEQAIYIWRNFNFVPLAFSLGAVRCPADCEACWFFILFTLKFQFIIIKFLSQLSSNSVLPAFVFPSRILSVNIK